MELADDRFRNADDDVLVNQVTDGEGVWVGQSLSVREDRADAVATAVASALLE